MKVTLYDKIFGCLAGCHIGSSMGAQVEGMPWPEIKKKYEFVDKFESYEHYHNGWKRMPGTTEDGVERQKLMITAISEKGGRVNAEDVRAAWVKHANPNAGGWVSEPFEGVLLAMAKTMIPATDLGRYCDYAGLNSFARACHAIGLINAGNVKTAIEDILQVGQLYQTANSRGLQWACVTGVSIAAATMPNATVDSVIAAVYDNCHPDLVVKEIDQHLKQTAHCKGIEELREYFDDHYNGVGMPYPFSYANEVVTKGISIFKMTDGNVKDSILAGVNMGRDTDCVAAVAAGISGSLSGGASIPQEWIEQLDKAAENNPHTNTKRSLKQHTDLLYSAYKNRLKTEHEFYETMIAEL